MSKFKSVQLYEVEFDTCKSHLYLTFHMEEIGMLHGRFYHDNNFMIATNFPFNCEHSKISHLKIYLFWIKHSLARILEVNQVTNAGSYKLLKILELIFIQYSQIFIITKEIIFLNLILL